VVVPEISTVDKLFPDGMAGSFFDYAGKLQFGNCPGVPTPHLLPNDYEALASFRYAMRKFLKFSKQALAAERMTPEQYEALLAMKAFAGSTGLTITELSERLQVKHHTAVSLVDRLAALGFARRTPDLTDRRRVYVRLTAAGSRALLKVAILHRQEMRVRSVEMIESLTRLRE
jgi:DNA-binding MarR family transcriptional regulator